MTNIKSDTLKLIDRSYIAILLVIFGGIVLHAPLSVGLGALWPDYNWLIKSWKEILMLIAGLIALFLLYKNRRFKLLRDPIIITIAIYAVLHLIILIFIHNGLAASAAGLAIDLRYVFFFGLVYVAINLYPNCRKIFIKVGIIGALVVLIFALLQVFILPHDVLKYIGYNANTISPYLTVDQNPDFIRINSTLRGPNPLGAYAGIVLVLIMAAIAKCKINKEKCLLIVLSFGGIVALWFSYSRSALVGAAVAILIVLIVAIVPRISLKSRIVGVTAVVLALLSVGILMTTNTQLVSNILLHDNPVGGSSIDSNQGHIESIQTSLGQSLQQPFGAGIGSTGSASLYSNNPVIIENQYLFMAHEVGWLGLALFVLIFTSILIRLWTLRQDWLALGVFASGIGLALIGLLLPIWVDDTVAIIWWGLAAIALWPQRKA